MKRFKVPFITLLLAICFVVPASATNIDISSDTATNIAVIGIDDPASPNEEQPILTTDDTNDLAPRVKIGTITWRITRQSPGSTKCVVDAQYVAAPTGGSASYLRFTSLLFGRQLDWDAYGSFEDRSYRFDFPVIRGFVFIGNIYVPTDVSSVQVRETGLQVYVLDSGWTTPGLGGSVATVTDP